MIISYQKVQTATKTFTVLGLAGVGCLVLGIWQGRLWAVLTGSFLAVGSAAAVAFGAYLIKRRPDLEDTESFFLNYQPEETVWIISATSQHGAYQEYMVVGFPEAASRTYDLDSYLAADTRQAGATHLLFLKLPSKAPARSIFSKRKSPTISELPPPINDSSRINQSEKKCSSGCAFCQSVEQEYDC